MVRSRKLVAGLAVLTAVGLGALGTACSSSDDASTTTTTTASSSNGTVPKSFSVAPRGGGLPLARRRAAAELALVVPGPPGG